MSKTLYEVGVRKIAQRFADAADHIAYTLDGAPKTAPPFRKFVDGGTVKIYAYFDDTVVGEIRDVRLIDADGDAVAGTDRVFVKPPSKGLYVAFKYNVVEVEVESLESL